MNEEEVTVTIRFPNRKLAEQWMIWHDGVGEQWFWSHAEQRGEPAPDFDYDHAALTVTATLEGV